MAATIEGRVRFLYNRTKFIDAIYEKSLTPAFKTLSVVELQSRLNDLLHQWKRLDEQHEKFLTAKAFLSIGTLKRCL